MTRKTDLSVVCLVDDEVLRPLMASRAPTIRTRYNLSVLQALQRNYRKVGLVGAVNRGIRTLEELWRMAPDVVFNLAFSGHPAEASFAGALHVLGIPFTGSGAPGISLANDKVRSRHLLHSTGIRVPRFAELTPGNPLDIDLTPPLIVKPAAFGGCRGVYADSLVSTRADVEKAVRRIWNRFGVRAVCDEFIVGREFRIGAIEDVAGWGIVGITEWHFPLARPGWGYKTESIVRNPRARKRNRVTRKLASLSAVQATALSSVTTASLVALGIRGYATVDTRMDELGRVTVLEVNANPGLWSGSSIWSNPTFDGNIQAIVDSAAISQITYDRS